MPGLVPGPYEVEAFGATGIVGWVGPRLAASFNVARTSDVVEYYAPALDHYFVTAWPDEVKALDAGTSFKRTGERFKAWLRQADAPAYAVPVCRFYATGPNSHFYTADPAECQMLKSLEQKAKAESGSKGEPFRGWQFEAIAFYALAPQQGTCPAGTTPVARMYNDRAAQNDSNHRFTATEMLRFVMSYAWIYEGVAFCSPA